VTEAPLVSPHERDFTWRDGGRTIRFRAGALAEAPTLLAEHGFEDYAFLTTDRAVRAAPVAAEVRARAGVVLEVPPGGVPDAAGAVRGAVGGRPLVALGGGRTIDSAKAIAAVDALRCAALPTTLSGAEITRIHRLPAGVERAPGGLRSPALVIADPELMASQARLGLTASAMNALAHGAEALYGPGANPAGWLAALRGVELIAGGLATDEAHREALALGSVLCAWALDGAGLGLHHALCQTVVRLLGTPHAQTNAVILPHVLDFVAPHTPDGALALSKALGSPQPAPEDAGRGVAALAAGSGSTRLWQLGVERAQLGQVVDAVLERPELETSPGRPGRAEVTDVLVRAL
jgi:alcohol dehydrogenase class IV